MSYTIPAFCGGGIRGLLSATLLQRLFPINAPTADLLAGTSTGSGIISWLLAGQSPAQICQNYLTQEAHFFSHPCTDPQFPAYNVKEVLAAQCRLHDGDPKLSTFKQSVLFTSFNVGRSKTEPWTPLLLHNLANAPEPSNIGIAEAVASSSAMPGMLGSVNGNIDGAFVNHDPTLAAVALALSAGVPFDDIYVICFGTGYMPNWIASDTSTWGAQPWLNGDENSKSQTPPLLVNGTVSPVLNATLSGTSTNLMPQLAGMMLGTRYVYLNAPLDWYIPENDVKPTDLQYLQDQAAGVDISAAQQLVANYW